MKKRANKNHSPKRKTNLFQEMFNSSGRKSANKRSAATRSSARTLRALHISGYVGMHETHSRAYACICVCVLVQAQRDANSVSELSPIFCTMQWAWIVLQAYLFVCCIYIHMFVDLKHLFYVIVMNLAVRRGTANVKTHFNQLQHFGCDDV